ncbi:MAG: HlyD family efflux transporter periplasmic adaptor subunit [Pseudomonadota bacterium]
MRLLRAAVAGVLALALAGCQSSDRQIPMVEMVPADLAFEISAEGELVASESLPITVPASVRMRFNIAWMAPEYSEVKAGEVIARFDDVQIKLDQELSALNVAKSEFKLAGSERDGGVQRTRIGHDSERVAGERIITETFASADQTLFSRNEIIDALADVAYLDVQASYLDWEADTFDQRIDAEQNLIRAERDGEQSKLDKQRLALNMMEVRSPADGTFVYARTPWGEKLGKGKSVFPGSPVGLLPVKGKVKARIYVPEADAVGLAAGQVAQLRLDADTTREFAGEVTSVSPVASPRTRANPQKFFVVEVKIIDVDPELMRVGGQLRARVVTGELNDALVVPSQAVYGDKEHAHVFVINGGSTSKRSVTLGRRSPNLVEVLTGLERGDRVSLIAPPEQAG